MKDSYDYIIVGAGSAGCALAARLTEDGRKSVLLLEAGEDDRWIWTKIPAGVYYLLRTGRSTWRFFTDPEPHMNGRRISWPRGRNLGGSSTVNGMIWVHGDPAEYDHWRDGLGLGGWGFSDLRPLFTKVESYPGGEAQARGQLGPVAVTKLQARHPLMDSFREACVSTGIPATEDYNDGNYEGVDYLQFNTRRGWRQGGRETYLKQASNRPNLDIVSGAMAERVVFEGKRAVGVAFSQGGKKHTIRAGREVILTAGSIQSPQLLELSGIGAGERLREHGIDVVHDLPAVGENMQDHLHTRLSFRCRDAVTMNQIIRNPLRKGVMGAQFALFGTGLMTCAGQIIHALAKSTPEQKQPDVKIQLHWLSSPDARDPERLVLDDYPGISIGTFPLRPKSRGSVHIRSRDPAEAPSMSANYLDHEDDVAVTLRAIRMAREIAAQPAMKAWGVEETRPGADLTTDDELLDFTRKTAQTSYHPIGSCRMGTDDASVVDERLRVRGVEGLRVADASVFPSMCSANTNAPAMVVGEKAAIMIAEDAR